MSVKYCRNICSCSLKGKNNDSSFTKSIIKNLRGAFKKVCNSIWSRSNISKIFTLFFNIIAHNSNMYVKSVKKLFYASQIELWSHAVQIWLSTQWPVWSHCHHGTTSSDDEIHRSHWVPGLVSRMGVTTIPIRCSLLQPAQQEQGSKMITRSSRPLNRTWRACYKNPIWLASKSFLINVTYALLLRVIILNNNIKILLVSFVHHTELQNFLNAPRIYISQSNWPLSLPSCLDERTQSYKDALTPAPGPPSIVVLLCTHQIHWRLLLS